VKIISINFFVVSLPLFLMIKHITSGDFWPETFLFCL